MDGTLIQYNVSDGQFHIFAGNNGQTYTSFCIMADNSLWLGDSEGFISLLNPEDGSLESHNLFAHSPATTSRKLSMLSPSPSSANIYVAFEHDDVKIFNVLSKTYQDLNIQEKNQLTILINCFLEKTRKNSGSEPTRACSSMTWTSEPANVSGRTRWTPMHYPAILSQPCLKTAKTESGYASTKTE